MDCHIGLLLGTEVAEARAGVERCVEAAATLNDLLASNPPQVEWHGLLADGYVLEPGSEAEAVLAAADAGAHHHAGERHPVLRPQFGSPGLCYRLKGRGACLRRAHQAGPSEADDAGHCRLHRELVRHPAGSLIPKDQFCDRSEAALRPASGMVKPSKRRFAPGV
ncbi:hypothetical protein ACFQU2_36225 [Siccirubricoccus deserti]